LLGLSQSAFGQLVGLAFQQIQKYERGWNRISASRLYEFSYVLGVPVSYFFDQMPAAKIIHSREYASEKVLPFAKRENFLTKRETLELVRAFYKIRNARLRAHIISTVSILAEAQPHQRGK
jgi:transcriptional regulator with XRE-family HTH domain